MFAKGCFLLLFWRTKAFLATVVDYCREAIVPTWHLKVLNLAYCGKCNTGFIYNPWTEPYLWDPDLAMFWMRPSYEINFHCRVSSGHSFSLSCCTCILNISVNTCWFYTRQRKDFIFFQLLDLQPASSQGHVVCTPSEVSHYSFYFLKIC